MQADARCHSSERVGSLRSGVSLKGFDPRQDAPGQKS